MNRKKEPEIRYKSFLIASILIFAFSLSLRIVIINHATWHPISDTSAYHELAKNVVEGNGYKYSNSINKKTGEKIYKFVYRAPGYPLFLALLYSIFGWFHYFAYLSNVFFELVTEVLILAIVVRYFGRGTALLSQFIFSFQVLWTPNLMTESIFTAFFMLLTFLLVYDTHLKSGSNSFVFGVLLTMAIFIRPIALLFIPMVLMRLYLHKEKLKNSKYILAALLLLPVLIVFSSWSIRNYLILKEFVPLTTNLGQHNASDFSIDVSRDYHRMEQMGMNEVQINKEFLKEIRKRALKQPYLTFLLYIDRFKNLFSLKPVYELNNILWKHTFKGPNHSSKVELLYKKLYGQYLYIYILFFIGIVLYHLKKRRTNILVLIIVIYVIFHSIVSYGSIRFIAPVYPLICAFAGYTANELIIHSRKLFKDLFQLE